MTRADAIEILSTLQNALSILDDEEENDNVYALSFAIADMKAFQQVLDITDGIVAE